MKNFKLKVTSEEESQRAQCKLFELGFSWVGNNKEVKNKSSKYLFVFGNRIFHGEHQLEFIRDRRKEITFNQLIQMSC